MLRLPIVARRIGIAALTSTSHSSKGSIGGLSTRNGRTIAPGFCALDPDRASPATGAVATSMTGFAEEETVRAMSTTKRQHTADRKPSKVHGRYAAGQ